MLVQVILDLLLYSRIRTIRQVKRNRISTILMMTILIVVGLCATHSLVVARPRLKKRLVRIAVLHHSKAAPATLIRGAARGVLVGPGARHRHGLEVADFAGFVLHCRPKIVVQRDQPKLVRHEVVQKVEEGVDLDREGARQAKIRVEKVDADAVDEAVERDADHDVDEEEGLIHDVASDLGEAV